MTLHRLKIFECVVRYLNITKASATLHMSQPSVSQQLKLLEEEFGKKFFTRVSQGVELTAEGKEFFDAIRPMLAEAENLEKVSRVVRKQTTPCRSSSAGATISPSTFFRNY